jgi:hypothetical protein
MPYLEGGGDMPGATSMSFIYLKITTKKGKYTTTNQSIFLLSAQL